MDYKTKLIKAKKRIRKSSKMTCIIGCKCIDGIVLISDKKITSQEENNRSIFYKDKLFSFYYHTVVGSSGSTILFEKFRDEAWSAAQPQSLINLGNQNIIPPPQNVSGVIHYYPTSVNFTIVNEDNSLNFFPYLQKLEEIVKKLNKDYSLRINGNFDVLFASQTGQLKSILYYIGESGVSQQIDQFKIIGSGESSALIFFKSLWNERFNMMESAQLEYFVIKLIEKFDIDGGIGVGNYKPQIWFLPDKNELYELKDENIFNEFESKSNEMIEKFLFITK